MDGPTPSGSYRMHRAVMVFAKLATPHWEAALDDLRKRSFLPEKTDFEKLQLQLWVWLIEAAQRGQVVFMGMLPGSLKRSVIDMSILEDSKPNFEANTLEMTGMTFHMIRVAATDPAQRDVTSTTPVGRPSSAPLLIAELHRRWQAGCLLPRIGQEAAALHAWHAETHPGKRQPTAKSVAVIIRGKYHDLQSRKL